MYQVGYFVLTLGILLLLQREPKTFFDLHQPFERQQKVIDGPQYSPWWIG
jgi:hypothetical protein